MANLSNINNILRTGSLGVGINRDPLGAFEISSVTKPGIKMFNTAASGKTYEAYSDVNGSYIIYDQDADDNRFVINTSGNATFAGNVGIGISPGENLHIFKSDATALIQAANTSGIAQLQFFPRDSSNVAHLQSIKGVDSNLTFLTGGNSGNSYVPTERVRIENTGVMKFANTATSTGDVGTIAHYTNNYMYIRGGAGGLAIGDDGFDVSIYLNNSDSMSFNTAGVQKMRINSQGQTWIGGSTYTGSDIANGNTSYLNNLNAGAFSILHRNSSDAYLHFNTYYTSSNTYVSKYTGIGIIVGVNAAADNGMFFSKAPSVSAGAVQTYETGIMQIGYGANNYVGIGTTLPGAKLEIAGTAEARYLHVDAIAGFAGISSTMAAMVDFENAGDGNNVSIKTNNSVRTDAAPFSVWTEANSRFIIRNDGNVGIGTYTPDEKLEISGDATGYPHIKLSNPSQTGRYLKIGMIDSVNHCIETVGGSTYLTFKTVSAERMRIASNGDITMQENLFFNNGAAFRGAASIRQQSDILILTGGGNGFAFNDDTNAVS